MTLRHLVITLIFAFPLLTTATAPKAQELVDGSDPEVIRELIRGFGSATLGTDGIGDPMITARIEGNRFRVYFYDCENNRDCSAIQFQAGWATDGISNATITEWNNLKRFGKAYLDDENDPWLEMDVNLAYGVSRANLEDTIDWWRVALNAFVDEVVRR